MAGFENHFAHLYLRIFLLNEACCSVLTGAISKQEETSRTKTSGTWSICTASSLRPSCW